LVDDPTRRTDDRAGPGAYHGTDRTSDHGAGRRPNGRPGRLLGRAGSGEEAHQGDHCELLHAFLQPEESGDRSTRGRDFRSRHASERIKSLPDRGQAYEAGEGAPSSRAGYTGHPRNNRQ
jgi:hypothetical protein